MSKKQKLKLSNKPAESSQKDSNPLLEKIENPSISPQESISVNPSNEFQKDIEKSKAAIAEADAKAKGKPGRKALPRDANGNIIRDASSIATPQSGIVQPLNPKEVEENKLVLKNMVIPMLSGVAVQYALGDKRAAFPEEEIEPVSAAGGEILAELFPGLGAKYSKYGVFFGGMFMWGYGVTQIRKENIAKIIAEQKSTELKDGQIPAETK